LENIVIIKSGIAGLSVVAMGFVVSSNAASAQLSAKLKQTCAPAFRSAEKSGPANGLLCDIWTDPDCRALAVQKGILASACAFPKLQAPIRKPDAE
jgi:hypothetical protein